MDFVKTMSRTLWRVLAICSVCISCVQKKVIPTEFKPSSVIFKTFISTDLSEDQAQLSTKDDEVVVIYGIISVDNTNIITSSNLLVTPVHQIRKDSIITLNKKLNLSDQSELKQLLFIGLIEVDDTISPRKILEKFSNDTKQAHLSDLNSFWETAVITPYKTNDNLGYVLQRFTEYKKSYLIAGHQLTDRYEYYFNIEH